MGLAEKRIAFLDLVIALLTQEHDRLKHLSLS